jgi:hypothetical protein
MGGPVAGGGVESARYIMDIRVLSMSNARTWLVQSRGCGVGWAAQKMSIDMAQPCADQPGCDALQPPQNSVLGGQKGLISRQPVSTLVTKENAITKAPRIHCDRQSHRGTRGTKHARREIAKSSVRLCTACGVI